MIRRSICASYRLHNVVSTSIQRPLDHKITRLLCSFQGYTSQGNNSLSCTSLYSNSKYFISVLFHGYDCLFKNYNPSWHFLFLIKVCFCACVWKMLFDFGFYIHIFNYIYISLFQAVRIPMYRTRGWHCVYWRHSCFSFWFGDRPPMYFTMFMIQLLEEMYPSLAICYVETRVLSQSIYDGMANTSFLRFTKVNRIF